MTPNTKDNRLKGLLAISEVYDLFQHRILGGRKARQWLANNFWKLKGGESIVDIGCGSGAVVDFLPAKVDYLGIDISENYIRAARKKYSARATFFLGTAAEFLNQDDSRLNNTDLVLCNGLLHHLPDAEATEILEIAKRLMKPGGRLVCLEATFLARQSWLSKRIVSTDRGRYVRTEKEWKMLLSQSLDGYATSILTGLIRIPYTHIVIEYSNEPVVY